MFTGPFIFLGGEAAENELFEPHTMPLEPASISGRISATLAR